MLYFSSDLHFGHNKPFLYEPRGFNSIEEHDEAVIKRWNEIVQPDDEVYILGDLMLGDNEHGINCLNRLNGELNIIRGNHDTLTRMQLYMSKDSKCCYADDALWLDAGGYHFYLSHFPTITSNFDDSDKPLRRRLINLYGHTHQKENFYNGNPYMYHVGMDSHNCTPVSIEEIIKDIQKELEK